LTFALPLPLDLLSDQLSRRTTWQLVWLVSSSGQKAEFLSLLGNLEVTSIQGQITLRKVL
jgi:hypothetical protein